MQSLDLGQFPAALERIAGRSKTLIAVQGTCLTPMHIRHHAVLSHRLHPAEKASLKGS